MTQGYVYSRYYLIKPSNFISAFPMRKCWKQHSCTSSTFVSAIILTLAAEASSVIN